MATPETDLVEEMFVQVARGSHATDDELTLIGLSPSTLYFSDRPQRVVGHSTTEQFCGLSTESDNSSSIDPPDAVLSFVDPGEDHPDERVVVWTDPQASKDSISYRYQALKGLSSESVQCMHPVH
jgi:hypothetical protein